MRRTFLQAMLGLAVLPCLAVLAPAAEPAPQEQAAKGGLLEDWARFKDREQAARVEFRRKQDEARLAFNESLKGKKSEEQKALRAQFHAEQKAQRAAFNQAQKDERSAYLKANGRELRSLQQRSRTKKLLN